MIKCGVFFTKDIKGRSAGLSSDNGISHRNETMPLPIYMKPEFSNNSHIVYAFKIRAPKSKSLHIVYAFQKSRPHTL